MIMTKTELKNRSCKLLDKIKEKIIYKKTQTLIMQPDVEELLYLLKLLQDRGKHLAILLRKTEDLNILEDLKAESMRITKLMNDLRRGVELFEQEMQGTNSKRN